MQTPDGVHIAYQVLGQGPRDIVFVPGLMSHLDLLWDDADTAGFFRRLATLGRVILFDKRDTGLSDRAAGNSSLDERISDVMAVMGAAGSARAVLFGYTEGAPMSILFAAAHPQRVSSLILGSAAARWLPAPDYPCGGQAREMSDALRDIAANRWGQGDSIDWYLPSRAGSPHARELFARFERLAVTPGAFLRLVAIILDIDVRAVLPAIHVPTLIIQRLGDRITPPWHGRYLASRIAGARYFEQPGDHSLRFAGSGDSDALFQEISAFLADAASRPQPERGARARDDPGRGTRCALAGPGPWRTTAHEPRSRRPRQLQHARPGDPLRRVAAGGAAAVAGPPGCGIHTGEVTLGGDESAAAAVRIAQDVAALAKPGDPGIPHGQGPAGRIRIRLLRPGQPPGRRADESWHLYAVTTAAGGR